MRTASVGYLVPRAPFDATVHSVYRSACNLLHRDTLLTLGAFSLPDGPATIRLEAQEPLDLRDRFRPGESVRVDVDGARTWMRPFPMASAGDSAPRLDLARTRLQAHGRSVLHLEAAPACALLEDACRSLDACGAEQQIARLIGWGEGLTPAGDDFLVGLLAALHALASDEPRRAFVHRIGAAIVSQASGTTALAAHYLRLAADNHFNADIHAVRDELLAGTDVVRLAESLDQMLSRGATSGADLLIGMLAGARAWTP